MTIPGIDATVALSIVAAVGDFSRFQSPQKLVSYLGLNPRVRQSGGHIAYHGRITKQGRAHARGMLVEAAWVAAKVPGPLRAFYERVRGRRGMQIAVVATARKLAVLCWHMISKSEDYAFERPSLTAKKLRALELRAGQPSRRGQQRRRGRLLAQRSPPTRERARRTRRTRLPPARRELASEQACEDKRARVPPPGSGSEAVKRQPCAAGLPSPRPALRSGVTRAHPNPTTERPMRT